MPTTDYFSWLVELSGNAAYIPLFAHLNSIEFRYSIEGDGNRYEDGLDLRARYFGTDYNSVEACSVFEVLVAFAERCSYQSELGVADWIRIFLENLGLLEFRRLDDDDRIDVDHIVDIFLDRLYQSNGEGGLFPLRRSYDDQRNVELYFQFFRFLDE